MRTRKKISKKKKKGTKAVPKHMWGALIGTAINTGMSLLNANKNEKVEKENTANQYKMAQATARQQDALVLDEYEEEGSGNVSYYNKKGGKLANSSFNTKGGKLVPISSDMDKAKGNKHNESKIDNTSGIKLLKGGKAIAEIEDEEMVKDDKKVYSDVSIYKDGKTYAEVAEELATQKGALENSGDKQAIAKLDKMEDELFAHQEANKSQRKQVKPKALEKGGKILEQILPFADNLVNTYLTSKTPKIRKPQLQKPVDLVTDVNVNPQVAAVNDAVDNASKFIQSNTSNSNTARAEIGATKLQGSRQKANIFANKENKETQLKNRKSLVNQQVQAQNLDKINAYGDKNTMRENDIQSSISANVANAVGDVVDRRNFKATEKYNAERLDIAKQYGYADVVSRADFKNEVEVKKMIGDEDYAKKVFGTLKTDRDRAEFKRLTGYDFPIITTN